MSKFPVGKPVGGTTPEIALKWLQSQIAERKSQIARYKLDINDLQTIQLPKLEALILEKENDIKYLTGQIQENEVIDV